MLTPLNTGSPYGISLFFSLFATKNEGNITSLAYTEYTYTCTYPRTPNLPMGNDFLFDIFREVI